MVFTTVARQFEWVLRIWQYLAYMLFWLFFPQIEISGAERGRLIRNDAIMLAEEKVFMYQFIMFLYGCNYCSWAGSCHPDIVWKKHLFPMIISLPRTGHSFQAETTVEVPWLPSWDPPSADSKAARLWRVEVLVCSLEQCGEGGQLHVFNCASEIELFYTGDIGISRYLR